jgi:hypothetical protein
MISPRLHPLVQLRPRHDVIYVSQNRTVLATGLNGFVETELSSILSSEPPSLAGPIFDPQETATSNVGQHSWLGYYLALSTNAGEGE